MAIRVVEASGSHVLVEQDGRFAVVERRGGKVYPVADEARGGEPDTPAGLGRAAAASGWRDEAQARERFQALVAQGDTLARRLW